MNNPISSWLRKGAIPLALVCLAGPALASRTVTGSDSGGGGPNAVAISDRIDCNINDSIWGRADACSGVFSGPNLGAESALVQALVEAYDGSQPAQAWSGSYNTPIGSQTLGTNTTPALFAAYGGGAIAKIDFAQDFVGSFVVVLSGTWAPVTLTVNSSPVNWSAYYLFDDVEMFDTVLNLDGTRINQIMEFRLYGDEATDPVTGVRIGRYVMRGMDINQVSIYAFDVTRTASVPEPSSLLLSGLALGALGAAAALARRRRPPTGSTKAL